MAVVLAGRVAENPDMKADSLVFPFVFQLLAVNCVKG
jgi:hypothetical protein